MSAHGDSKAVVEEFGACDLRLVLSQCPECLLVKMRQSNSPERRDWVFAAHLRSASIAAIVGKSGLFTRLLYCSLCTCGWDEIRQKGWGHDHIKQDGNEYTEDVEEDDDGEPALTVVLLPPLQHWARPALLLTLLQT